MRTLQSLQGVAADVSPGGMSLSTCSASLAQACAMSRRATLRAESVTVCAISAQYSRVQPVTGSRFPR